MLELTKFRVLFGLFVVADKMARSKTGVKRKPVDPDAMKKAIEAVTATEDKRISLREACNVYNVKLTTLSRALSAFKKSEANTYIYSSNFDVNRVFNDDEEILLVEYIKTIAKMNYGLSKKGVRQLAYKFGKANSKKIPKKWEQEEIAGEQWMRCFMARHRGELSVRKPEATSLSRSTSFNKENISLFFANLEDVHRRFGPIAPDRIWNVDETGLTTVHVPGPIVAPKGIKQIGGCTSAERGTLVTMIAGVNAIGNHIPPMLIFPRVYFKERMLSGAPVGTIGAATSTGWSNEEMFLKFLEHFMKHVKSSKEERVLLIMDNHETHLSVDVLERASSVGIVIVTFPPHTSHRLQPLDVSVYAPFKTFYNQALVEWHVNNPGKTFDIYCVSQVVGTVFPRAFAMKNIISGYKATGIFPLDKGVFTDEDFLSSFVTDRPHQEPQQIPLNRPTSAVTEVDLNPPSPSDLLASSSVISPATPSNGLGLPLPTASTEPSSPRPNTFIIDTQMEFQSQNRQLKPLTPEQVQPFPKAGPRKTYNRGRKPGRTRIATDTPEKEQIKEDKMRKIDNRRQMSKRKSKNLGLEGEQLKKNVGTTQKDIEKRPGRPRPNGNKKQTLKRKCSRHTSSSSEDDVPLVSTDDEDSADEECIFCGEPYRTDRSGEQWIRCVVCLRWSHELCAGTDRQSWKTYICDMCN